MLNNMTRTQLITGWVAAVIVSAAIGIVLGVTMTVATAAMLLALVLVPVAIVLMLWPGVQPRTAAEVLYDRDRSA